MDSMKSYTLSVEETAKALHVSKPTVYALMRSKDFPVFKVGRRTLISADGLRVWISKQVQGVGE